MIIAAFTGSLATDAVLATTNFCANPGALIASTGLAPQRYPITARLIRKMRALWNTAPIPFVTPIVLTLWKNLGPTAMTISIPPSTAQYTQFLDQAHPIQFNDGDTFDIQAANAGGVNGTALFTVVLEGD